MRFRKPELIPLLFIICATLLLVSLGTWQVERLAWKNALVADIEKAQSLPPLTELPQAPGTDYRNVMLRGRFLHDKSMHTIGAAPGTQGISGNGFHVLTPFILADNRIILVDRGWSPLDKESRPEGTQTISGILRPPHPKHLFAPENRPDKNIWFSDNFAAMGHFTNLTLAPFIVQIVGKQERNIYPVPSDGHIVLRNDHLQYAITWFSVALIGLVMFGFYHRIPEEKA